MSDRKAKSRFGRVVIRLCVLVAIGVWIAKIWVVPSLVRSAASSYLGDVWFGTIEIDEVDVSIFGPSYVRGVTVRDNLDRTWLSVPKVRIEAAWDGFAPRLAAVRVDVVNVSPQFVDGKCTVPLKPIAQVDDGGDIVDIISDLKAVEMTVDIVTLRTVNSAAPAGSGERSGPGNRTLDGIVLPPELARKVAQTNIIFPAIEWKGGKLSADKVLGEIGDDHIAMNLSGGLQSEKLITFSGKGLLLAPEEAFNATFEARLLRGGVRHFEVALTGQVKADFRCDIQSDGTARATLDVLASNIQPDKIEWLIGPDEMVWLALEGSKVEAHFEAGAKPDKSVEATGRVDSSGPIGEVSARLDGWYVPDGTGQARVRVNGKVCGGKLQANAKALFQPEKPVRLALEASAKKVRMADLTRILAPHKIMQRGIGTLMIRLGMSGSDRKSISGRGAFFLDDADLWQAPILSALFRHMKLKLNQADIQGSFNLTGTTATTITGQLATMVWAADFQEGGTVDFDSGLVDMYVIFLPIKQAGILMNLVRAVNPLRLVAKEVFRLHVTGHRDNPRITPVPFSDLGALSTGTLGFLKGVAASGGQLGGDIFKAVLGGGK